MLTWLYEGQVTVTNINQRPEFHGEDKALGVDIDITMPLPVDQLAVFSMDDEKGKSYRDFLFTKSGEVRANGIKQLILDRDFEDHMVTFKLGRAKKDWHTFHAVHIRKFKAIPLFGSQVQLHFQVQIQPETADMAMLSAILLDSKVGLKIDEPAQKDLVSELQQQDDQQDQVSNETKE